MIALTRALYAHIPFRRFIQGYHTLLDATPDSRLEIHKTRTSKSFSIADTSNVAHFLVLLVLGLIVGRSVGCCLGCESLDVLCNSGGRHTRMGGMMERYIPLTFASYSLGWRISSAAASPFNGSLGLGYRKSCGKKTSKMLIISISC